MVAVAVRSSKHDSVVASRPTLGGFMSIVCFHQARFGCEDVAGRVPVVAAGRQRGQNLVRELGLVGATTDPKVIRDKLAEALGPNGTRLCLVTSVSRRPGGGYEVRIKEGACTAGQVSDEPVCAFTLGAFIGAIETVTGQPMMGTETECIACGAPECVYLIDPL